MQAARTERCASPRQIITLCLHPVCRACTCVNSFPYPREFRSSLLLSLQCSLEDFIAACIAGDRAAAEAAEAAATAPAAMPSLEAVAQRTIELLQSSQGRYNRAATVVAAFQCSNAAS